MTQGLSFDIDALDFTKEGGLIPVIVQDAQSLRVLMLGYMNREALDATRRTGLVTFYSRSKKRLWQKGESSGNVLQVCCVRTDCDKDALLVLAQPKGPTCHTGSASCFGDGDYAPDLATLAQLGNTIRERRAASADKSYTASLFAAGLPRMAQKVGEEGVEVALAALAETDKLPSEAADLIYHLFVLLEGCGKSLTDVLAILAARATEEKRLRPSGPLC